MTNTDSQCAHYTKSLDALIRIRKHFAAYMWIHMILMGLMIAITVPAIAFTPRNTARPDDLNLSNYEEGELFLIEYSTESMQSFGIAVTVVIPALLIIAAAVLSATQWKALTIVQAFLYVATIVLLSAMHVLYLVFYLLLLIAGLACCVRQLFEYRELDALKQLPGYPHFNERLTQSEKPREELDLSTCRSTAPMEALTAPATDVMPAAVDPTMNGLLATDLYPQLQPEAKPVNLIKPRTNASMYDVKPDAAALPTLDEIRARYGQNPPEAHDQEET